MGEKLREPYVRSIRHVPVKWYCRQEDPNNPGQWIYGYGDQTQLLSVEERVHSVEGQP